VDFDSTSMVTLPSLDDVLDEGNFEIRVESMVGYRAAP
jgi:hypothetical protein